MLADDALIMSHRLQQWLARAPELEEETALANIALDLLGQARLLLSRAGPADGTGRTEDDYAFGRAEREFRNVRLAEASDADFGGLIARLLVFSTWRLALLVRLRSVRRPGARCGRRAGRAGSSPITATTPPSGWSGSATAPTTRGPDGSRAAGGRAAGTGAVRARRTPSAAGGGGCRRRSGERCGRSSTRCSRRRWPRPGWSGPPCPPMARVAGLAGRDGVHTEAMGYLLAELQSIARSLPGATW